MSWCGFFFSILILFNSCFLFLGGQRGKGSGLMGCFYSQSEGCLERDMKFFFGGRAASWGAYCTKRRVGFDACVR